MFEWNDGSYLAHYGIPGQKWGIRRFQNEDGSLTAAGKERYGVGDKMGKAERPSGYQRTPYRPHSRKVSKHLGGALPFKKGEDVGDRPVNPEEEYYLPDTVAEAKEAEALEKEADEYADDIIKDLYDTPESLGYYAQVRKMTGLSKEEFNKILKEYYKAQYLGDDKRADAAEGDLLKMVKKNPKSKEAHGSEFGDASSMTKKKRKGIEQTLEKN